MKTFKRVLAMVLSVMLLVSCLVVSASAENNTRYSVLVLDVSGSMWGTPLQAAKEASKKFCEQVFTKTGNDKNYVAVVAFDTYSEVICEFTDDLNTLKQSIDRLTDKGVTNLAAGIQSAVDLLTNVDDSAIKNILVMCDGYPNEGYPDGVTAAYNVVQSIPLHWNIYGLYFASSGYSDSSAEDVMRNVGRDGFWTVDDTSNLEYVFADIWSEKATEDEVNNLVIRIACPVDVSVELNGIVLDKDNTKTLFGTLEFEGDGDDQVKIVKLAYREDYNIKVVGTSTGTMDYTISYRCNDKELYSLTYPTINVNPQSVITGKVSFDDKTITLDIDDNGDGVIDRQVAADGSTISPVEEEPSFFQKLLSKIKAFFVNLWEGFLRFYNAWTGFYSQPTK